MFFFSFFFFLFCDQDHLMFFILHLFTTVFFFSLVNLLYCKQCHDYENKK